VCSSDLILQMHPDVTVICDAAAYSKVEA